MGSRLKEDDRNERTIRGLLKQSENRRCINCASMGPQYVCTTFSIFVCTNCSGLHREFTHRIKSVSMAKFTAEEVKNLQTGGNERARETYLREYDFQRNQLPDSSNPDKLRDFIKSVYEDRRYTGDRAAPKGRQGDREDHFEGRRFEPRSEGRFGLHSPSFEDRRDDRRQMDRRRSDVDQGRYDDRRFDDRNVRFEEKRSPSRYDSRYSQKGQQDDRRQEDKYRNDEQDRRGSFDHRFGNDVRTERQRSADDRPNVKDFGEDSPPVRPVSEILGDNVPALWVEDNRQTNGRNDSDRSAFGNPAERGRDVRLPARGSTGNMNGNASAPDKPIKRVNSGSLIDFSVDSEPTVATDPFDMPAATVPQSPPVSSSSTGWATFDTPPPVAPVKLHADGPPAGYPNVFQPPTNGDQWATGAWPTTQTNPAPAADDWSSLVGPSVQHPTMGVGSQGLQGWKSFPSAPSDLVAHADTTQLKPEIPHEHTRSSSALPVAPRELPKELFAQSFPAVSMPAGGLGGGQHVPAFAPTPQPFGTGAMPTYAQPLRRRNPFDLPGDGAPSAGSGNFPNLGSLQAALPNGPLSVPATMVPNSSNQWSMGLQPASFPPSGPAAGGSGSTFGSQLSFTPSTGMQGQPSGPSSGYSGSDSFISRSQLTSESSGSSEFQSQNFMRTFSGNPFG